ncbi:MAG: dephospho-CoA kinase [Legionellaceae bacterium]|nr:dephospho-CoA kinase [Legionellaceae bacterium]
MTTFTVALTGGIGSGKSLAASYFEKLGVTVIDADKVAHDIVKQNGPAYHAVVDQFGPTILDKDGNIDRAALRTIVFNQKEQKILLESILHPIIREIIAQQTSQSQTPYSLLVIPLLTESSGYTFIDRVLVIDCDEAQQRERAHQRDKLPLNTIDKIISQQASRSQRLATADDIINNTGSPEQLEAQVNSLHQKYLKLASSKQ